MKLTNQQQYYFDLAKEKILDAIEATRRVVAGRETSLVITKLQEAELWLAKSKEEVETRTLINEKSDSPS